MAIENIESFVNIKVSCHRSGFLSFSIEKHYIDKEGHKMIHLILLVIFHTNWCSFFIVYTVKGSSFYLANPTGKIIDRYMIIIIIVILKKKERQKKIGFEKEKETQIRKRRRWGRRRRRLSFCLVSFSFFFFLRWKGKHQRITQYMMGEGLEEK